MATASLSHADNRCVDRDEVFHRARGHAADGRMLALLIVNISPHGLMARCETELAPDDRVRIALPAVGITQARVRWALGGRMGCEFERAVPLAGYYELLTILLKD